MAQPNKWGRMPWQRGNDSLVAVNPERITTLFALAVEHYGRKCAKCGAKGHYRWVVHHRHYRTIGFEKPVEDIVLLCSDCHDDLHKRTEAKKLSIEDLPWVDPKWEKMLPSVKMLEDKNRLENELRERARLYDTYPVWRAIFIGKDGVTEIVDTGPYKDEEEARSNFESEKEFMEYSKLVSFEKIRD